MVTTLYLLRHGQTAGNDTKRYHGSIDIQLSEKGKEQAAEKAVVLRRYIKKATTSKHLSYLKDIHNNADDQNAANPSGLRAVYCSGLSRAVQSAEIIARQFGLVPIRVPDLRERSFGIWEGMTFSEIKEQYPEEFSAWAGNPLSFSPIGGETTLGVRDRVMKVINDIVEQHAGEEVAVVAHGGVNRIILCHILGMPLENIFRIEQDYTALNVIEFWEKYPVLKLLNG
ncbi:MAG: histidine phosphatase family protein [Nitrospirota bacterium]|nr:histidine phosphatase family protein [Nitrospirota bacterium]